MSRSKTFKWHKRYTEGRKAINDDSRAGQPSTSKKCRNCGKSSRNYSIRSTNNDKRTF